MKGKLLVLLVVVILVAAVLFMAQPFLVTKTTTIDATADAYVDSELVNTNFGSAASVDLRTAFSAGSITRNGLVRFDFASLISGGVESIDSARLVLQVTTCTVTNPALKTAQIDVDRVTASWVESTVTYTTRPATVDLVLYTVGTTCPSPTVSIDVTSAVRLWVLDGVANNGFWLGAIFSVGSGAGEEVRFVFASREGGTAKLDIDYTSPGEELPGVGPGVNQTQNQTLTPTGDRLALAALIFIIVFILLVIIARKRPGAAIIAGTIGGAIAAGGYLLLGGA